MGKIQDIFLDKTWGSRDMVLQNEERGPWQWYTQDILKLRWTGGNIQ